MRGLAESLVFAGAAIALHLALWPGQTEHGAEASGAGGEALMTMQAANAAIAAQVAAWDSPPEVMAQLPETPAAPALSTSPPQPSPLERPAPISAPRTTALPMPALPQAPMIDTSPPAQTTQTSPRPRPVNRPSDPVKAPAATPPETHVMPSTASAPRAARVARGEGGEARGQSGQALAATLSQARSHALIAEWGARIRARIARAAPRGGGDGKALVNLTVAADGRLLAVTLARSSGNSRIDRLALDAVRRAGRFPAAPGALGLRQQSFTLLVQSR